MSFLGHIANTETIKSIIESPDFNKTKIEAEEILKIRSCYSVVINEECDKTDLLHTDYNSKKIIFKTQNIADYVTINFGGIHDSEAFFEVTKTFVLYLVVYQLYYVRQSEFEGIFENNKYSAIEANGFTKLFFNLNGSIFAIIIVDSVFSIDCKSTPLTKADLNTIIRLYKELCTR